MAAESIWKLAGITIGQSPRVDMTGDLLSRFPKDIRLAEYGALDPFSFEEVSARFAPREGDEVLVSRMADGREVRLAGRHVHTLLQGCIDRAESDGADAVLLLCTGAFSPFRHRAPLICPQPIFYAVARQLADGRKIAVLVPKPEQMEQARRWWGGQGMDVIVRAASPYGPAEKIREAAAEFRGCGAMFLCLDCMGFTREMKDMAGEAAGLPVLLPRTLVASVLTELFSFSHWHVSE